jgi:hypothetical protein
VIDPPPPPVDAPPPIVQPAQPATTPSPADPSQVEQAPSEPSQVEQASSERSQVEPPPSPPPPPPMSEGRRLVVAYNSGFHWGLSPGIVVVNGSVGFALGLSFGYGFETGPVIVVPGIQLSAYFTDPTVLVGMPVARVVLPIDRFAPFIEGGAGVGNVAASGDTKSQTGAALLGGGGFMVHFTGSFALGVEASYQTITGTNFEGIGIGPIIAIGF